MSSRFRQDHLLAILDDISDGVVTIDRQHKYVAINRAAAEVFRQLGKRAEEMIGKGVWEVFPEAKGTIAEREITKALRECVPISYEIYFSPAHRWYETHGYPSSEGVILIFRDITDRKNKKPGA